MRVTRPLSACTISLQAFLFFVIICVLRSALSTCQHITIFWYGIHSHCVAIIVIILSWTGTHSVAVADALARAVPTLLLLVINDNAQRENNFTAWSTWAGIQLLRPGRKLRSDPTQHRSLSLCVATEIPFSWNYALSDMCGVECPWLSQNGQTMYCLTKRNAPIIGWELLVEVDIESFFS